jgi:protein gp37
MTDPEAGWWRRARARHSRAFRAHCQFETLDGPASKRSFRQWFLLTKGPQNIGDMLPTDWGEGWPHVCLGTTTENQEEANRCIPHLVAIPAAVRFLSVEPMVGPVDLTPWLMLPSQDRRAPISWIIVGGESGGGARPMHPDWVRGLRDQVSSAGAKLFIKQIVSNHALWPGVTRKGEDPAQWPADLRVQEVPQ